MTRGEGFRREVLDASGTGKVLNDRASRRAPIKAVSDKRRQQLAEYVPLRDAFLEEHPSCLRCSHRSVDVHHREGRDGERLLWVHTFVPLCRACHGHVEHGERGSFYDTEFLGYRNRAS